MLRRRTHSRIAIAIASHSRRAGLSELESMCVHAAVAAFCRATPCYNTIKQLLMLWVQRVLGPLVPQLALMVCASHGAIANIDFSASDARQWRSVGKRRQKEKRTFGGLTGLNDVPLLPDLYALAEDRPNIELLVLTWLRLLQKQGLKPVGLNVDDIEKTFKLIVGCLDAGLPGVVLYAKHSSAVARKHLQAGGVVADLEAFRVLGFELGRRLS